MSRIMVVASASGQRSALATHHSRLALLFRDWLSAVRLVIVLCFGFGGIELFQAIGRGVDVVPAAVLEIDDGLAVEIDRDHAADNAGEPFELRAFGINLDELIGPLAS